MSNPPTDPGRSEATHEERSRGREDWAAVLAAAATILLSLAIAALILARGSSSRADMGSARTAVTTYTVEPRS
jgi:hypothetical protein